MPAERRKPHPQGQLKTRALVANVRGEAPEHKTQTLSSQNASHQNLKLSDWLTIFAYIDTHPTLPQTEVVKHFATLRAGALVFTQSTLSRKLRERSDLEQHVHDNPSALAMSQMQPTVLIQGYPLSATGGRAPWSTGTITIQTRSAPSGTSNDQKVIHQANVCHSRGNTLFDYDACDDLWTEIASFLDPANIAEKIQLSKYRPNSLDLALEFLQRGLEKIFFEETGTLGRFFETVINGTVALRLASADSVLSSDAPLAPVLDTVAMFVAMCATVTTFGQGSHSLRWPQATQSGEKHVSDALEYLQQLAIRPTRNHGIEQKVLNPSFITWEFKLAIEALLSVGAVLWLEAVLVQSLVILYCFGSYVLGKDVIETSTIWQMQVVLRS
ncbi:hypothetical protein EV363DRAFT_1417424 [Boletus edulis]|nr:hypothetical protein EV363DRAFT_1417424 [Boletus edulis]